MIKIRMNKLPSLPSTIDAVVSDAISKAVNDVAAVADGDTPVDTGHLKNDKEITADGLSGSVHWLSDYALHVHEGTRYQPSRPFAANAVEKVAPSLEQSLHEIEGRL